MGGHRHARSVVLDDESATRAVLEDWLHDYYDIDDEAEHLTAAVLTDEAKQYAMGLFDLSVEFAAEYLYATAYEN